MVGFIAGWATMLDYVISISLSALFIPHYVAGALGQRPNALSVPRRPPMPSRSWWS